MMPLQNRVTPFGEIVVVPERGTLMGNRGILHDEAGRIRRRWAGRAWISCVLEFRGRREPVMAPGHYTRLFFLDEPTALAAGHRPCAYCRRPAYRSFLEAWAAVQAANGTWAPGARPRAADVNRQLHAERLDPGGSKRTFVTDLDALPDGVMVTRAGDPESALLVWGGRLWPWSPGGYGAPVSRMAEMVRVLTPPSLVGVLAAGYVPEPPPLPIS